MVGDVSLTGLSDVVHLDEVNRSQVHQLLLQLLTMLTRFVQPLRQRLPLTGHTPLSSHTHSTCVTNNDNHSVQVRNTTQQTDRQTQTSH